MMRGDVISHFYLSSPAGHISNIWLLLKKGKTIIQWYFSDALN